MNQESASLASLLYNGKGNIVNAPPAQWLQTPPPPPAPAAAETPQAPPPKPKKRKRVSRKKDPIAEAVKLLKQAVTASAAAKNGRRRK